MSMTSGLTARQYSHLWWVNLLGFQALWWSCVLYGNGATPFAITLLLLHLLFHPQWRHELLTVCASAAAGLLVDTVLWSFGFYEFSGVYLPPLWLICLWLGFAATLNQGLLWLKGKWLLSSLLGAIGGSSSYLAANQLDAAQLPFGAGVSTVVLVVIWALLMPCLIWLHHSPWLDRRPYHNPQKTQEKHP